MGVSNFEELFRHVNHKLVCVYYQQHKDAPIMNVAIECETCDEVLVDYDNEKLKGD
jgi:hypothetical protein